MTDIYTYNDPTADQGPFPLDNTSPTAKPAAGPAPSAPLQRYGRQMEDVQKAEDAARAQEQAAMLKPMSALSRTYATPVPQAEPMQKLGPAPDAKEYQKNSKAFLGAMAVLGAVSSAFTRRNGTAALSAFAGAVNGWHQGNLEQYENAAKKWEQNTKATIENNRQILEKYRMALENRRMNIDQQMSQIQLIAAEYHDQIMYDMAKAKNYTGVAQTYEKNWEYTNGPKGIEATAAPLMATRKKEEAQQALIGERLASGQINPDGLDPQTGQPYTQQQKMYFKYTKQQYLSGFYGFPGGKSSGRAAGGLPGQLVAQENAEREARGEAPMTAQEEVQFVQSIRPPRSAAGMAMDTFRRDFQQQHGRPPGAADIEKFAREYSGEQSYGRTSGSMGARVESASNEVAQLIPQAVETSHNYLRGKVVSFNKIRNAIESGKSDPAFNDFELANFSLINAYTRAMNPQGTPHVSDRLEQHALNILSTAISPQAYDVQVRRLWKEVQASKKAQAETAGGRTSGDINTPVPGLDNAPTFQDRFGTAKSDDGWTVKEK